ADGWSGLAQAIIDAEAGDAAGFVSDPQRPVASAPVPAVIECLDLPHPNSASEVADTVAALDQVAPNLGGRLQLYRSSLLCAGWPTEPTNLSAALPGDRLPSLLGAGTWNDYAATDRMVSQVPGGVTISRDGPGHGLYWNGDTCVVAAADNYLVTGELPSEIDCAEETPA
ncbi:MAG: alpha/beta hydrolase, partial [Stackebrandtia sp.]